MRGRRRRKRGGQDKHLIAMEIELHSTASEVLDDAQTHIYGKICFPSQTLKSAKCPKNYFQHQLQRADDTLLRTKRP